jgi:hypothetical protein
VVMVNPVHAPCLPPATPGCSRIRHNRSCTYMTCGTLGRRSKRSCRGSVTPAPVRR